MKYHLIVVLFIFVFVSSASSFATTIYVDDDAPNDPRPGNPVISDPIEDGTSEHPYDAIQDALDAAVSGIDSITVRDGIYTGDGNRDLRFKGKAITLRSENGPEATIIDCKGCDDIPHRGFYFNSGEENDSILNGFTIKNGFASGLPPSYYGGGIYCYNGSPTIINCIVINNQAHGGGGICCWEDTYPVITDCAVIGNTSTGLHGAGGILCYRSSPTISNCRIQGNIATYTDEPHGGGISCNLASPTITNCVITGNTAISTTYARGDGGGIYCRNGGTPTITNCTIIGNTANRDGGGVCNKGSSVTLRNCILWGNTPEEIHGAIAEYCDIQGGWPGEGNIDADPQFLSVARSDYHLLSSSPCIDGGTETTAPDIDMDGETRPFPSEGLFDIGADEYVDADADGLPDWWELKYFSTLENGPSNNNDSDSFNNLEELHRGTDPANGDTDGDGLSDSDEVFITDTDPLDPDTDNDDLLDGVESNTGIYVSPGNTGTDPNDPDADDDDRNDGWEVAWGSNPFNPDSPAPGLTVYVSVAKGDDGYNGKYDSYQGGISGPKATIQAAIDWTLDGDTVIVLPGTYFGAHNRDLDFGGRAIIVQSRSGPSSTVIDCEALGRGFYFHSSEDTNSLVDGFTIMYGYAVKGGGIYCGTYTEPNITNCNIIGNTVSRNGGGIYCNDAMITNCSITYNYAAVDGAGIYCYSGNPTIKNCIIARNYARFYGGGIYAYSGAATIDNCTIASNLAYPGGGIYIYYGGPRINNSISWGNWPDEICRAIGTPVVKYCNIENGWPGVGNIDADPLFVSGPEHDYYLSQTASGQPKNSPCVDTGSDTAINLGLDLMSTRTDHCADTGIVDMGYHNPYVLCIYSITCNGADITIHWNAKDGVSYFVEFSFDLSIWHGISVGQVSEWTHSGGASCPQIYYRVREQ